MYYQLQSLFVKKLAILGLGRKLRSQVWCFFFCVWKLEIVARRENQGGGSLVEVNLGGICKTETRN